MLKGWRLPPLFRVPQPVRLAEEARRLREKLADERPARPAFHELEETLRVVRAYWQRRELHQLPGFHLRRSPWVLFLGPAPHLGDEPAFVEEYLRAVSARPRARIIVALVRVFLREYPSKSPAFGVLRDGLARLVAGTDSPRLRTWQERCRRFALLESDGPRRFAQEWLRAGEGAPGFPEKAGLTGDLAEQGFVVAAYDVLLEAMQAALKTGLDAAALLEQVLAISAGGGSGLRYPARRRELAEALLLPFVGREAPSDARERIRSFLLEHYGHPRVKVGNWHGVSEEAVTVMVRWEVRASLNVFFQIVDETARPEHWRYRRAFWDAYLHGQYIADAWVVLGARARRLADRAISTLRGSFGILRGGQPNHSVLLMRIGGLTIAEWSHDGSCRIWPSTDPRAPRLYQSEYEAWLLRHSDQDAQFTHAGSEAGRWQIRVAAYIHKWTGIWISSRSYMP